MILEYEWTLGSMASLPSIATAPEITKDMLTIWAWQHVCGTNAHGILRHFSIRNNATSVPKCCLAPSTRTLNWRVWTRTVWRQNDEIWALGTRTGSLKFGWPTSGARWANCRFGAILHYGPLIKDLRTDEEGVPQGGGFQRFCRRHFSMAPYMMSLSSEYMPNSDWVI